MLLMLSDEHKKHLGFLSDVSLEVVREFCRISLEFLKNGSNPKVYQTAAQKLGVSAEAIQHGVEGLMYLLTESAKLMINEVDFQDSIMVLGYKEEIQKELLTFYLENQAEIRHILTEMAVDLPHYRDLEWRLDVQLASRTLHHQVNPEILMKLHLVEDGEQKVHVLQTDPVNLIHLTRTLEDALQEMKTAHVRRILRNL